MLSPFPGVGKPHATTAEAPLIVTDGCDVPVNASREIFVQPPLAAPATCASQSSPTTRMPTATPRRPIIDKPPP